MERIYAIADGGVIVNTVVGDDDFAALIRPDHDEVFEVTGVDPQPGPGWVFFSDGYRPPQPYPSWVWSEDNWQSSIPRPDNTEPWIRNEATLSWVLLG